MVRLYGGWPFFAHNVRQGKHPPLFSYLRTNKLEVTVLGGTAKCGQGDWGQCCRFTWCSLVMVYMTDGAVTAKSTCLSHTHTHTHTAAGRSRPLRHICPALWRCCVSLSLYVWISGNTVVWFTYILIYSNSRYHLHCIFKVASSTFILAFWFKRV